MQRGLGIGVTGARAHFSFLFSFSVSAVEISQDKKTTRSSFKLKSYLSRLQLITPASTYINFILSLKHMLEYTELQPHEFLELGIHSSKNSSSWSCGRTASIFFFGLTALQPAP